MCEMYYQGKPLVNYGLSIKASPKKKRLNEKMKDIRFRR